MKNFLYRIIFLFLFIYSVPAHATALTSGTTTSGSLTPSGTETYTFSGSAGEGIMLHGSASYTVVIKVYKPDMSLWTSQFNRVALALPDTGTYTVEISANPGSASGPFDLYYLRGGDSVSGGALTSGQVKSGSLDHNAIDSYQFTGTAGEGIVLHASASYTAVIRIYKPDGSLWTSQFNRVALALPNTGTYTVAIYANLLASTGDYNLYYFRGDDSVSNGTLISGSARSGDIPLKGFDSYKFTGSSGNSLSISTTATYTRVIRVYRPDGSLWTSQFNSISAALPATGEYSLVIYGNLLSDTGPYTITLTTPPLPVDATDPEKSSAFAQNCVEPPCDVGNPINFDVGYKAQTETDYDAGGLTFSRFYRSDSTWTDNTVGDLWRHNYARTLDVTSTTAEIIDGSGRVISFTSSGGNWVADDPNFRSTFEESGSEYIYTLPDNTVERYSSAERLARVEFLGGGALDLSYNSAGLLESVTNENNRALGLTYNGGRLSALTTPDGAFTYSYDGNDNLTTVTRPDTEVVQYHYEDGAYVNALTGITDAEGIRFSSYDYDGSGLAVLTELAGGANQYDVTYSSGTSTTTNPLGKDTTYNFTNILDVRKIVQADRAAATFSSASTRYYNYNENGWLIGQTDWENNTTRYEYDERGNITAVKEAAGTADERDTGITYISAFNLADVITEPGKTTDYDYDTYGRMTAMTITDTATSETRITTYSYYANTTDPNGNLVLGRLEEIDGPRTDVTDTTEFDYDGNLDLDEITNALGQTTLITARDAAGRPATIEDPNGVETDLAYNSSGWLTSSTVAPGTALEAETTYDYDANGNLIEVILPNGVATDYSYDSAGRLTGIEDALGNTITYTLDDAGNITQEDYHDSGMTLRYTHDQVFDELSRLIESVGASAQTATYVYDNNGNLTTYTDPENNPTAYAYDALQRLIDSTDALSSVVELGYNGLDNLTSVEDQRDNTTTYTYNAFGDVTGETSPDRGTISYTVDKAGNITQRTDARGLVTNYDWDALNRLTSIEYPSDSTLNATLTYDLTTGCGTAGIGQLCFVSSSGGQTAYEYDDLGRVTDVTDTRGVLDFEIAYSYDIGGFLSGITLPSGREIVYSSNSNGQVSGVTAEVAGSPVNLASSITYMPFGPMNALTYGNSLTFSATFDQDYNPTNRTVSGGIYNHTYDTDDNGNIIQIGGWDYDYDALNRLDSQDDGTTATAITYDSTSNRLTTNDGTAVTYDYPSTSNRLIDIDSTALTYDSAGNLIAYSSADYSWNAAGQLEEVEISSSTVGEYTYDPQNRRIKKVAGGNTTHYVYGMDGLLYGEYDNSGDLIREYVYLNDEPLAQIDAGAPEVPTYLHADHLGTPRYGTNSGGTQVWAWDYDAFGNATPTGSVTVNLRMPGQYFDAESGQFYNWNRYYNPAIGRYISSDPIGLEGGLNTYLYVEANPLLYSDPTGEAIPFIVGGVRIGIQACLRNPRCVVIAGQTFRRTTATVTGFITGLVCLNESAEEKAERCDAQYEAELDACAENYGSVFGWSHPSFQGCKTRAFLRYKECLKNGAMAPKWTDSDVTGEPPMPKPPRGSKK